MPPDWFLIVGAVCWALVGLLQSANAEEPQPTNDGPEERQNKT